jgi:hypothetical protein
MTAARTAWRPFQGDEAAADGRPFNDKPPPDSLPRRADRRSDPTSSEAIRDVILEEKARGATVFLTTHDMLEADKLPIMWHS